MIRSLPKGAGEFLEHYPHDARRRWSPEDLAAQEHFIQSQTAQLHWLDWSTESAALQLLQAKLLSTTISMGGSHEAILLAGPAVELLGPDELFFQVAERLQPGGRLIGIVPGLRDNSPESELFAQLAASTLWPYYTAEELLEMMREAGLTAYPEITRFVNIGRFNEAVLKDELRFKGFRDIFRRFETEGYDPMEVGWGELRIVACGA